MATLAIQLQHGLYVELRANGMASGEIAICFVEFEGVYIGPVQATNPVFWYTYTRPGQFWAWLFTQAGPVPWDWNRPWATAPGIQVTTVPAVDTVTPNTGPLAGGTIVRLEDTGGNPGIYDRIDAGTRSWITRVRVGSGSNPPQATNLNIVNSKRLEFRTPAGGAAGNAPIILDYNIGSTAINNINTGRTFTYQAAPFTAEVVSGTALQVTVRVSAGLTGTAQARVYFRDPANPSAFVTVTGNSPQATHTYSQPGSYQIDVTRVSDNVTTQVFYQTLPVATAITPAGGGIHGGETVRITGQLMNTVEQVIFGSRPALGITPVSSSAVDVITPSNTGLMPVRLVTPYGTIPTGLQFLYRDMPVQASGRGLQLTVTVGGIEDTTASVTAAGSTQQATPAQPTVNFTYSAPQQGVVQVVRAFDGYTVETPWSTLPYIDSITPEQGRQGTVVQLQGGLLQLVEEVWFDGRQVEFTRISDTLIEAVADGF